MEPASQSVGTFDVTDAKEPASQSDGTFDDTDAKEPASQSVGSFDGTDAKELASQSVGTFDVTDAKEPASQSVGTFDVPDAKEPANQSVGTFDVPDAKEPASQSVGTFDVPDAKEPASQSVGTFDVPDAKEPASQSVGTFDVPDAFGKRPEERQQLMPEPNIDLRPTVSERIPDFYDMSHDSRGLALIINNMNFKKAGFSARDGSDVDADNLADILTTMGFQTEIKTDLTVACMLSTLWEYSARNEHRNSDCFVCTILSHGEEGSVYGTNGKLPIADVFEPFNGHNCPGLVEKPKIFFIQACRGQKVQVPVSILSTEVDGRDVVDGVVRSIPAEADFLMAYSVAPGYYSWRNSKTGSWFIKSLVEVLRENWSTTNLLTMMTQVCKKVAYDYESNCDDDAMSGMKQSPCITSMLTRHVYFTPKNKK